MENEKEIIAIENDNMMKLGSVFAESGMFSDVKTAAQGFIKILAGKELGISPIQSQNAFYFVDGKIGVMSNVLAGLVKKSEDYDYKIIEHTNEKCVIEFFKNGESVGISEYNTTMAAKSGLVNKNNWKDYPMNMLFARAISNGARWFCPDVAISSMYTVEELQDLKPAKKTIEMKDDKIIEVEADNG